MMINNSVLVEQIIHDSELHIHQKMLWQFLSITVLIHINV